MAIVDFSELYTDLLSAAPTLPTLTAKRVLRRAARLLCEKTNCYQVELENIVVPAGVSSVSLDVPAQTVLHKVVSLTLNGKPLEPSSAAIVDADNPNWRASNGTPYAFWRSHEETDDIILAPTPQATLTAGLRGWVAVKPSRTSTGLEEVFLDRYEDVIIDGALADILMTRSAPWYDPQLALIHKNMFDDRMLEAMAMGHGDDMFKPQKVRYGGI